MSYTSESLAVISPFDVRPAGAYFKVTAQVELAGVAAAASVDVTVYTANPATTPLVRPIVSGDWMVYAASLPNRTRP